MKFETALRLIRATGRIFMGIPGAKMLVDGIIDVTKIIIK